MSNDFDLDTLHTYVGSASPDKPGSPLPLEVCLLSTFRNHIHFEGEFLVNGLPWWVTDKESACNAGDLRSIPGLGRSPGEGNGYPLQYSCLENSLDRGALLGCGGRATVSGITKSWDAWVTNTFTLFTLLENTVLPNSSSPWSRKWQPAPIFLPGKFHGQRCLVGYSPWSCRVRHNWVTEQKQSVIKRPWFYSVSKLYLSLCHPMACNMPGFPVLHCLWSLLKFMSTESVLLFNRLILCHPLLLPSIFPRVRVFSSESTLCIRWPKYWSFSFSINPFSEYSGWFLLGLTGLIYLQFKGLLESPAPQFESINSSVLSLFYGSTVCTSHLYVTTGKTIALSIQIFVISVMSLLFNTLSRFVIAFLPRSKCLLISWLQSLLKSWLQWFWSP